MGTATALFVINQVYACDGGAGTGAGGDAGFDVDAGMMQDAGACEPLTGDEFIFDVQTHHVNPNGSWRDGGGFESALAGFPQAGCGEPDFVECFDADHYIRELFVNSDTAVAVLSQVCPDDLWFFAAAGAMAAVNADTWATELGVLSPTPPRLMTTGQRVPAGTSGGVTALGTTAALGGGLFIGLMALALGQMEAIWGSSPLNGHHLFWLVPISILGGLGGSTFDSLLGATVQGIYYCPRCQKETEARVHRCGQPTRHLRGWRWLNNDWINFASSIVGSLMAGFLGWVVF